MNINVDGKVCRASTVTRQHRCNTSVPCFERFQTNSPSVFQLNNNSHRYFLSHQQPRFLQATIQLHQSRSFQQQALSGIESISGCTFNSISWVVALKKNLQLKENVVEWMKANPTRSATVWNDHWRFGNVSKCPRTVKDFEWLPDFVISVSVINVAIYLLTEHGGYFCPLSLHRPRGSASVRTPGPYKDLGQNIPPHRPPARLMRI